MMGRELRAGRYLSKHVLVALAMAEQVVEVSTEVSTEVSRGECYLQLRNRKGMPLGWIIEEQDEWRVSFTGVRYPTADEAMIALLDVIDQQT